LISGESHGRRAYLRFLAYRPASGLRQCSRHCSACRSAPQSGQTARTVSFAVGRRMLQPLVSDPGKLPKKPGSAG
jgi:hypothetical protein